MSSGSDTRRADFDMERRLWRWNLALAMLVALAGQARADDAAGGRRILVCFRNDDISAASDVAHERRVMEIFSRHNVPQTIGIIPAVSEPAIVGPACGVRLFASCPEVVALVREWLDQGQVEVALHGFSHQSNPFVTVKSRKEYSEFRGLPYAEQLRRIRDGIAMLQESLGVTPGVFIPPWNEWDLGTLRACADSGIKAISADIYTSPHAGLLPVHANSDIGVFPAELEKARQNPRPSVIVVLYHSRTTTSPADLGALERAVELAGSASDVRVVTLGELAGEFGDLAEKANVAGRNAIAQVRVLDIPTRGKATVYRRLTCRLGVGREVENLYTTATRHYHGGEYEQSIALSPRIDSLCNRIVWTSRLGLALSGLIYGFLAHLLRRRLRRTGLRIALTGFVLLLPAVAGLAAMQTATHPVSQGEVLTGALTFVAAACVSLLVWGVSAGRRREDRLAACQPPGGCT
jgi:hypothetical protein